MTASLAARCAPLITMAVVALASPLLAQELEPQRWRHLPNDTNFLTTSYIHLDAEIAIDPVLGVDDATSRVDTWAMAYMRTFELFGKSAQIRVLQPFQNGEWEGTVDSNPVMAERQGLADTDIRFAMHLFGAPPLSGKEYMAYRASSEVHTAGGIAFSIQLPTGEYKDDKLINLGTNQYVFRPEIGIVHDRGNWSFEASGIASFYTDNNSYVGNNRLELAPLWFVQANALYRFRPDLWAAAGVGYAIGAESSVNGNENNDRRENILWGAAAGYSFVPWLGVTLKYIHSENRRDIGTSSDRYIVSLSTFW